MPDIAAAQKIVTDLIDVWCERRALRPLRAVLPAYPFFTGLTDEVAALYEALRSARASSRDDLPPMELEQLDRAISILNQALHHRDREAP